MNKNRKQGIDFVRIIEGLIAILLAIIMHEIVDWINQHVFILPAIVIKVLGFLFVILLLIVLDRFISRYFIKHKENSQQD